MSAEVKALVERLFRGAPDRDARYRRNPVTGEGWVSGEDPIEPHKLRAERALLARAWFATMAPPDAPPLPLSYDEREDLKRSWHRVGRLGYIISLFARSLAAREFVVDGHPCFDDYVRGVLASPLMPAFLTDDPDLRRRYPPRPLAGLGSGLVWEPDKA